MISVIIPIFNASTTLARCIDSVLRQTYQDFELILVNDGSKDNSLEICKKYQEKEPKIKVIDMINQGVSNARNTGILHSIGDYITFIDSDDYMEDTYLEKLFNHHEDNYLTLCGFKEVFTNKQIERKYNDTKIVQLDCSAFVDLYDCKLINSPTNKLYDASIIRNHSLLFDRNYYLGEDLLFNLAYMKKLSMKGFIVINQPLMNYMIYDQVSLSKTFKPAEIEVQETLFEEIIKFIENDLKLPHLVERIKDSFYYALLYRFDGIYKSKSYNGNFNRWVKETIKENKNSSLKEILRISKNSKLKVKLLIICWLGFDVYYKLFGYK